MDEYDRFYMLLKIDADGKGTRDIVQGRFMLRKLGPHFRRGAVAVPGIPNAFTVERGGRLPNIADGGCWVVSVYFDLATGELLDIVSSHAEKPTLAICNGLA